MNPARICFGCFQEKDPGSACPHCGFHEYEEQPYLALPLGAILNGRYMVGKVLGIGGFGITYLGFDLTLEIRVAIKEYMPSGLATRHSDHYSVQLTRRVEEDFKYGMDRFLEEARVLARLQNTPSIVSVQNYFKENSTAYFVMEYIEGMSLKDHLAAHGEKIPLTQALSILQPVMKALVQVHSMNLLHRDISPDNIYITSKGESRLLDFGAARFALGDGKSVSIILKHGYAPEEQYSSRGNQGPWTDVYAMGATLYRSITGILPPDSLGRTHGDTLKTPSELGIPIPARVEKAILTALAVNTEDRFPNMESFIEGLNGNGSVLQTANKGIKQIRGSSGENNVPKKQTLNGPGLPAFSAILSYLRANPLMTRIIGGVLVVTLVIILPMVLSRGDNRKPVASNGGITLPTTQQTMPRVTDASTDTNTIPNTVPNTIPATVPVTIPATAPTDLIQHKNDILNVTIDVPASYVPAENALSFTDEEKAHEIFIEYYWRYGVPIYSLSDIEINQEKIVETYMGQDYTDFQIVTSRPFQIGEQEGHQILVHGTDLTGYSWEIMIQAVNGQTLFGSYLIISKYPEGDPADQEEILSIIDTFRVNGPIKTTTITKSFSNTGVKLILDETLVKGGIIENTYELPDGSTDYFIRFYPTEENKAGDLNPDNLNAGGIELVDARRLGSTPEEVLSTFQKGTSYQADGERYTIVYGGVDWLIQDYTHKSYQFRHGSALIDGKCYGVLLMFDDSIENQALTLWEQVLSHLRPLGE